MIGSEKPDPEVRLFRACFRRQQRGHPPHQILRRHGRRVRHAPRSRRHRPRRRSRWRIARHRVPAHQGRQALRYRYPWFTDMLAAIGNRKAKAHGQSLEIKPEYAGMKPCKPTVDPGVYPAHVVRPHPSRRWGRDDLAATVRLQRPHHAGAFHFSTNRAAGYSRYASGAARPTPRHGAIRSRCAPPHRRVDRSRRPDPRHRHYRCRCRSPARFSQHIVDIIWCPSLAQKSTTRVTS